VRLTVEDHLEPDREDDWNLSVMEDSSSRCQCRYKLNTIMLYTCAYSNNMMADRFEIY